MRKLPTKGTNITLSSLGLGTGTGFNKDSFKTQKELFYSFDASFESGVNWIDTAESYAEGYAETLIGEYRKISKIILSTLFLIKLNIFLNPIK